MADDRNIDEPTRELPESHREPAEDRGATHDVMEAERRPRRLGFFRAFFGALAALLVFTALAAGLSFGGWLPGLPNIFAQQETDRSQPPLLVSIKDLSRFVAAEGTFEVIIDIKKDRKLIPDWLLNQRTLFVAVGTVEAYVDFGQLTDDAIVVSGDRRSVQVTLPRPELADPNLDVDRSYVFAEQRGLINRISDFFDGDLEWQQQTLQRGTQRLADAAKNSTLRERAEVNTRRTLEGMLHSLGYDSVTVAFVAP